MEWSNYPSDDLHLPTVYQASNAAGELLYVGVTVVLESRLHQHAIYKVWWSDTTIITIERFATRQEATTIEEGIIRAMQPCYNLRFKKGWNVRHGGRVEVTSFRSWDCRSGHPAIHGICPYCSAVFTQGHPSGYCDEVCLKATLRRLSGGTDSGTHPPPRPE